jgi:hypothetical protein
MTTCSFGCGSWLIAKSDRRHTRAKVAEIVTRRIKATRPAPHFAKGGHPENQKGPVGMERGQYRGRGLERSQNNESSPSIT